MRSAWPALLLAVVMVAGCRAPAAPLAPLGERPLSLPRLAAGARCPVSRTSRPSPSFGEAVGGGPVYGVGLQAVAANPLGVSKVLWIGAPAYSGPVRIRGGRLDGAERALFGSADAAFVRGSPVKSLVVPQGSTVVLYSELDLPAGRGGDWRDWPSETYAPAPGCYGWQVDGDGFSELLVVAVAAPPIRAG